MSERRAGVWARAIAAWRALTPERRLAAAAALALFATMLLPWYQVQGRVIDTSVTAFGAFSFIEAAVLLVAIGALALLFARAEGHDFHMPGGDGAVVLAAGAWTALLLVWRLFDKPDAEGALVGVHWGIFVALGAAGALAYAGARMRGAERPEPLAGPRRRPRPPSPPAPPGTAVTRVLPPELPRRPARGGGPGRSASGGGGRDAAPSRRAAAQPSDQLTIPLPPADDRD